MQVRRLLGWKRVCCCSGIEPAVATAALCKHVLYWRLQMKKGCGITLGFICYSCFFPVRASNMSYFTAFSREIDAFYTSPSTSPAPLSTSPACPTNIPSITNKSWVTKSTGSTKQMIQIGGHFNPSKKKRKTKKRRNKTAGGLGGAAAPP